MKDLRPPLKKEIVKFALKCGHTGGRSWGGSLGPTVLDDGTWGSHPVVYTECLECHYHQYAYEFSGLDNTTTENEQKYLKKRQAEEDSKHDLT